MNGMLQVFFVNVYALLDPGATLSFVTPLVSTKFYALPDFLIEPFSICTPMGDSVISNRAYKKCLVMLSNDLVELDKFDFDIILGMDLLLDCFASIDCTTRVVKF